MKIRKRNYLVWGIRNDYSSDSIKPVESVEKYNNCNKDKYEPIIIKKVNLETGPDGVVLDESIKSKLEEKFIEVPLNKEK